MGPNSFLLIVSFWVWNVPQLLSATSLALSMWYYWEMVGTSWKKLSHWVILLKVILGFWLLSLSLLIKQATSTTSSHNNVVCKHSPQANRVKWPLTETSESTSQNVSLSLFPWKWRLLGKQAHYQPSHSPRSFSPF